MGNSTFSLIQMSLFADSYCQEPEDTFCRVAYRFAKTDEFMPILCYPDFNRESMMYAGWGLKPEDR